MTRKPEQPRRRIQDNSRKQSDAIKEAPAESMKHTQKKKLC